MTFGPAAFGLAPSLAQEEGPEDEAWFSESPVDKAFAALDEKRFADAAKALRSAGDDAMANYMLGCIYRYGSLGKPDLAKAKTAFETSARGNCVDAALALANLAYNDQDRAEVDRWLKRAYVLGMSSAALDLANVYAPPAAKAQPASAIAWARIAKAEEVDGADLLEKRLTSADPDAAAKADPIHRRLAKELAAGRKEIDGTVQIQLPVEMFLPEGAAAPGGAGDQAAFDKANASYQANEFEAALGGFTPLAEAGNPAAAFYVGRILEMGYAGEADPVNAQRWYRQAAAGGIAVATSNLGFMILDGRGCAKDPKLATDFFLRAAYSGALDGALSIGFAYGTGEGREKNLVEAAAWYSIAADLGAEAAEKNLRVVEREMSSIDRVSAKSRRRDIEAELRGDAQPKYALPELDLGPDRSAPGGSDAKDSAGRSAAGPEEGPSDVVKPLVGGPSAETASLKPYTFKDPLMGGMEAYTIQIPDGWHVDGELRWNPQDAIAAVSVDAMVGTDDGTQVQFLPSGSFSYFDGQAMPGGPPLPEEGDWSNGSMFLNPGQGPEEFVTRVIMGSYRPGVQDIRVVSAGEAAPVSSIYSDFMTPMIEQMAEGAQQSGFQTNHKVYCPLIRVSYTDRGQAFEEEFSFMYMRVDMTGDMAPGKKVTNTMWSVFDVRGVRAPKGQLDDSLPLLRSISCSLQASRPWAAVLDEINAKVLGVPAEFQKLQVGSYEQAMQVLQGKAAPMVASVDQLIVAGEENWTKMQGIKGKLRSAWAGMSNGGAAPVSPIKQTGRRGGFRVR